MSQFIKILYISRKDMESYYAKPPLITWGLLFPAVLLLATYLKDPQNYGTLIPGIIGMILLFGNTSMAAIVITFEKRTGTLVRLLLAPLTCRTIILGKAFSAACYGLFTALVFTLGLAVFLGLTMTRPLFFAMGLLGGAAAFSFMGLIASMMVKEVFEAMTLMNFFRFPSLFISGVFIPLSDFPAWLVPVTMVSPLTHVVELLRYGITGSCFFSTPWTPALVLAAFLALGLLVAGSLFRRGVYG